MPGTNTVPMDPAELSRRAIAITGSTAWRAKMARLLGVNHRTVERWEQSGHAPEWLHWALRGLEAEHVDKKAA